MGESRHCSWVLIATDAAGGGTLGPQHVYCPRGLNSVPSVCLFLRQAPLPYSRAPVHIVKGNLLFPDPQGCTSELMCEREAVGRAGALEGSKWLQQPRSQASNLRAALAPALSP